MSQRKKQRLAAILILIFAIYYANISFFYHSHTINGLTISHSHFYGDTHTKSGTHTASELALISVLSVFQSPQAALCATGVGMWLHAAKIIRSRIAEKPLAASPVHFYLRAPPASR